MKQNSIIFLLLFSFMHLSLYAEIRYGQIVELENTYAEDLYLIGEQVHFSGDANANVSAVAGNVFIQGTVHGDLHVFGGQVKIEGEIQGNLLLLSGNVEILPGAKVRGNIFVVSGNCAFSGATEQDLTVYAANLQVSGTVAKDLHATIDHLRLTKDAKIYGQLTYQSPVKGWIDPDAIIQKGVHRKESLFEKKLSQDLLTKLKIGSKVLALLMNLIYTIVISILLFRFFPSKVLGAAEAISQKPLSVFFSGLIFAICLPLLFILLLLTIIGIPFALTLLAINVLSFYTAKIVTIYWGSIWLIQKGRIHKYKKWFFFGMLLVYFLLTQIPYFGYILSLAALFFGLGGLLRAKSFDKRVHAFKS